MKIVKLLIFNVERWTNKGPKKALLCLVTNYSLIVWSERVTELKVMKGTFQTEIAFSCVSKMKVVVYLSLLCSSDSIKYMLLYFFMEKKYQKLTLANNDQGSADTRLGNIQKSTSKWGKKKKLTSKWGNVDSQNMFFVLNVT